MGGVGEGRGRAGVRAWGKEWGGGGAWARAGVEHPPGTGQVGASATWAGKLVPSCRGDLSLALFSSSDGVTDQSVLFYPLALRSINSGISKHRSKNFITL